MDSEIRVLFKDNLDGKLVLPNFQRDFEWTLDDQKKLVASVLTMLPIGSLLILEGKKDSFATKEMCFNRDIINQKEDCFYLLDGQQRLSCLKSVFDDLFESSDKWTDNYERMFKGLRNRWFIKIQFNEDEKDTSNDIFGIRNLNLRSLNAFEPDQLLGLIEVKKITKSNKTSWYHPAFIPKGVQDGPLLSNKLKFTIAREAAKEGLVPLYTVYGSIKDTANKNIPLHKYVLQEIADERVKQLKADVADGKRKIEDILVSINPLISEIKDNDDDEESRKTLEDAWASLKSNWVKEVSDFLEGLLKKGIHKIELPSEEIGRANAIFESVNKGGIPLSTFDLIVAKAARDQSLKPLTQRIIDIINEPFALPEGVSTSLKEDANQLSSELLSSILGQKPQKWLCNKMGFSDDNKLPGFFKDQFLNLLSIFSHSEYGKFDELKIDLIKKNKHLSLTCEQVNLNTINTVLALKRACAFLQFRCGIVNVSNLNFKLMLLPIAYILRDNSNWNDRKKLNKIEYWYWSSLFSGAYNTDQNQKCIEDIKFLYGWISGRENKFKYRSEDLLNTKGYSDKKVLLFENEDRDKGIPKAIESGILQYILSKQPFDFLPNAELRLNTWEIAEELEITYPNNKIKALKIQDHHIIPLGSCTKIGESSKSIRDDASHILNSPLNRSFISELSNNLIKDKSPEKYFEDIPSFAIWGHCIPSKLEKDDNEKEETYYKRILEQRYDELLKEIKTELKELEDQQ